MEIFVSELRVLERIFSEENNRKIVKVQILKIELWSKNYKKKVLRTFRNEWRITN